MFPTSQFTSATAVGKEIGKQGTAWKVGAGCLGVLGTVPTPASPGLAVRKVCVEWGGEEVVGGPQCSFSLLCYPDLPDCIFWVELVSHLVRTMVRNKGQGDQGEVIRVCGVRWQAVSTLQPWACALCLANSPSLRAGWWPRPGFPNSQLENLAG